MTLRDDMTLAEAQAEAERRWPGAKLTRIPDWDVRMPEGLHQLAFVVREGRASVGYVYVAASTVGCLDQAIAAEARRKYAEQGERYGSIIDAATGAKARCGATAPGMRCMLSVAHPGDHFFPPSENV